MTQIKLRRDTSANFTSANPVLGVGEPAYETDTKKLKIGDGTTAYTQLEYFSTGGGGSTNITATLPLKIVDGVISLEVDGQTIQIVDGKLHANLDDKQDKFETQVPLSISSSSITTSVPAGITETTESWSGGGPDKLITVDVSALNIDANSDWKIHLSGYMGDFRATMTNTNVLLISAEKNVIFRVWFGSADFRLGNGVIGFKNIPDSNREFFYEIVHQRNSTEFTFNGTDLVDSSPLSISKMSGAIGSGTYTTLAGQGKLKDISFVINSYQFQRIDRDITKSYFEADGVKYRFTSVAGTNTLNLNIGSGLSVVDGKLTASSTAPSNMVTTDTAQNISGQKEFDKTILFLSNNDLLRAQQSTSYRNGAGLSMGANSTSTDGGVFAPQWKIYSTTGNVDRTETIVTTYNQSKLNSSNFNTANKLVRLDSDGKLPAIDGSNLTNLQGGSSEPPTNMVTTDTTQTITGDKTFNKITLPTGSDTKGIYIAGKSAPSISAQYGNLSFHDVGYFQCQALYVSNGSQGEGNITLGDYPTTGSSSIKFTHQKDGGTNIFNGVSLDVTSKTIKVSDSQATTMIQGQSIVDKDNNKFLTSGDKETIMGYIMPDYSTRTEVPWNTDNTAPTDGYVEVFGEGDGSTSAFVLEYTINGVKTAVSSCYATSRNTNFRLPVICPKGTVYSARGGAFGHDLHFISMKGAV